MWRGSSIRRTALSAAALLVLSLLAPCLDAQGLTFTDLTVSVADPAGAVIPAATVRAVVGQTEVAIAQTDSMGKAVLRLAPGSYTLRAEALAFRSESVKVDIKNDVPLSYAFRLQVGGCTECVDVQAGPVLHLDLWMPPLDCVWISPTAIPTQLRLRSIVRVR